MLSEQSATVLSNPDNVKFLILGGVAVFWIGVAALRSTLVGLSRERTKREIAAYVSEGTMTPEQGERLAKAAPKHPNT